MLIGIYSQKHGGPERIPGVVKRFKPTECRVYQLVLQCIGNPGIIVLAAPHNVAECAQFVRVGVEIDKQSYLAPPFGGFAPGRGEDPQ